MTTRLYLVRHGATQLTAEDRFSGAVGIELSTEGRSQAERLAQRLADDRIVAVYASPQSRALDTAAILARPHGLSPIVRDGLREISHGHWEGMRRSDVEERFGEEYAAWEQDPLTFAPTGGESGLSVLARALPVIRDIVRPTPARACSPCHTRRRSVSSSAACSDSTCGGIAIDSIRRLPR
jgi:broad specificity phosphatase PhoE